MQNSNLADLFNIQRVLEELHYPDYKRVSLEILEFVNTSNISLPEVIKRLKENEPWEYIQGYTQFCGFKFLVTRDTLIPRIETEQIVYMVLEILKKDNDIYNIVDVGTGTGCIPISIRGLGNFSNMIYATDLSKKALEIAKMNEESILKGNYIHWMETDLIQDLSIKNGTLFTVNLPYIPTQTYMNLDRSVRDYEPRLALDGGFSGLILYEKLFKQILDKNIDTRYIIIETEESIFSETVELVTKYFQKAKIDRIKDVYDRDRFLLVSFL